VRSFFLTLFPKPYNPIALQTQGASGPDAFTLLIFPARLAVSAKLTDINAIVPVLREHYQASLDSAAAAAYQVYQAPRKWQNDQLILLGRLTNARERSSTMTVEVRNDWLPFLPNAFSTVRSPCPTRCVICLCARMATGTVDAGGLVRRSFLPCGPLLRGRQRSRSMSMQRATSGATSKRAT